MERRATILAVVVVLLVSPTAGCTLIEACGLGQQEYCTEEGECTCGKPCEASSDCGDGERCKKYRYNPSHGVCIDRGWLARHDVARSTEE
ncbi:MAG: hypothetical protein ABEN55_14460 [Bradymonadaceae bacterium]